MWPVTRQWYKYVAALSFIFKAYTKRYVVNSCLTLPLNTDTVKQWAIQLPAALTSYEHLGVRLYMLIDMAIYIHPLSWQLLCVYMSACGRDIHGSYGHLWSWQLLHGVLVGSPLKAASQPSCLTLSSSLEWFWSQSVRGIVTYLSCVHIPVVVNSPTTLTVFSCYSNMV